jgi:hypothetical protein
MTRAILLFLLSWISNPELWATDFKSVPTKTTQKNSKNDNFFIDLGVYKM